jgi:hypothetical protein
MDELKRNGVTKPGLHVIQPMSIGTGRAAQLGTVIQLREAVLIQINTRIDLPVCDRANELEWTLIVSHCHEAASMPLVRANRSRSLPAQTYFYYYCDKFFL